MIRTSTPRLLSLLFASGLAALARPEPILLSAHLGPNAAKQSSYWQSRPGNAGHFGNADIALTGARDTFAFHTNPEVPGAWWTVDLGSACYIKRIEIVNRKDGWQDRARSLDIYISDEPFTSQPASWKHALKVHSGEQKRTFHTLGISLPDSVAMPTKSPDGIQRNPYWRYVGLRLTEAEPLHLQKVEVWGWR